MADMRCNTRTGLVVEIRGREHGHSWESGKTLWTVVRPGETTFRPGEWCPLDPFGEGWRKATSEDLQEEMT